MAYRGVALGVDVLQTARAVDPRRLRADPHIRVSVAQQLGVEQGEIRIAFGLPGDVEPLDEDNPVEAGRLPRIAHQEPDHVRCGIAGRRIPDSVAAPLAALHVGLRGSLEQELPLDVAGCSHLRFSARVDRPDVRCGANDRRAGLCGRSARAPSAGGHDRGGREQRKTPGQREMQHRLTLRWSLQLSQSPYSASLRLPRE